MKEIEHFMMGAVTLGHFVAALFFLKFWTKTRDRLFLWFSAAFWLLGLNRVVMIMTRSVAEDQNYVYWVRFLGYVVILIAILDKNRSK